MKKKRITKAVTSVLLIAVVAVLLLSTLITPQAEAASYSASYISRNEDLTLNYKDYLDESVAYELPDTVQDSDTISVIVMLEDVTNIYDAYQQTDKTQSFTDFALFSQEAAEIEEQVAARKAEILSLLDQQNVEYTVTGIEYTTLLAGFEIYITARDFEVTCQSIGDNTDVMVSEAYHVAESQVVENPLFVTGGTGITDTTGVNFDGSGMVVAVLDTGLDYSHSAFDPSRFTSTNLGLTYEQVAALLSQTMASEQYAGLTVDDVYISDKVPFGFDYADYDPDVYSTHNNHGTHVSGIIVGNDDTILGVAPNAQLVSMKVFSDVYDTALASWILSALEDCVVLGVDVINMSLGTACGFSREGDEEKLWGVYDKIRDAGISLIVAASNSYSSAYGSDANGNLGLTTNPDTGTVGSPGTYDGAMSVASIDGTLTPYLLYNDTIIYFTESNDNGGNPLDFCASVLNGQETMELEYVVVPGVGRAADYTGLDVNGKIALVRRGDTTFEEKALLAQNNGAIGIIIYNNVAGDIKMNVGDATLASCSISQDAGEMLAAAGGGTLTFSVNQAAGPFISDFSSWGPTPDLTIKPEITGYGGNILSSVTGGGYERLSGTSMATPNLAGISILLRQYVCEAFPEIADDNVAVNDMVYRLLMSTADITYNKNGLPYAVRKQGSGLANLQSAVATPAVLLTYDSEGNAMDKVKLELGDDKEKTGVYTMTFTVQNFGGSSLTYNIGAYVMTEGVSETLTNAGMTTVTEQGYLLSGATLTVDSVTGGSINGTSLTVGAGQDATVTVTVTLSDEDKAYMDASFANGMYVEGFITLTATEGTEIDMSVPYLAFYGDWTQAPLFDKEYYETNADELNDAIDEEDKNKADAYATTAIGGISDDYVSYLGSYYFEQDPSNSRVISASKDYIALSNQEGTIHSLRFVWAGLLRNAAKIVVTITDDTTGEVVFETVDTDVRKSYGDGGSIYPANVEIEFDTMDYNLMNNSEYTVTLVGYLDYEDGGIDTNQRNVFSFPLVVDFEAPTVTDAQFYYTYDRTLEKNRLYVDFAVYDNHYAMAMQVGYVKYDASNTESPLEIVTFSQYMTPIYSVKNGTTVVTYELTDYIYEIKENAYSGSAGYVTGDSFVVTCYDYALNYATFEIGLPNDYTDFYMDGLSDLTLSPNEVYSLEPLVYPNDQWAELLEYRSSNKNVVNVVNNKLVAVAPGTATIQVRDPSTNKNVSFKVTVLAEGDEGYVRYDKPVADVFRLDGFYVDNAFFQVNSSERDIGSTGETRHFDGNYSLSMYPDEQVSILYTLDAFFPDATTVEFSTSNENVVSVNANGTITAEAEGYASITVKIYLDGRATYYSESITVEVKDPFITAGATLSAYFGKGGVVTIPGDLKITTIGSFAFSNFDYVLKSEEEYAKDDSSLTKQWYVGNDTITKVIIPEGVKTISSYAFASLTALEEIVLPSTLESIEYGAFYGCTSLKKITFSGENNLKIINQSAFELCDLQGTLDLPSAYVISNYAFAGNVDLKGINLPDTLQTIGAYAFAGCSSLTDVNITADKVKFGEYAFSNCTSLESFRVNASVIPAGMFYSCKNLTEVYIGEDVKAIYEYAFRDSAVTTFHVESGNTAFKVQSANYVISADGKTLVAVCPTIRGEFTAEDIDGSTVTTIGRGAFSHNVRLTTVNLPEVTRVEAYGFAVETVNSSGKVSASRLLTSITLGQLTYIGDYGFCGVGLETLPNMASDATFGKYAFAYSALKSVHIPDGMTLSEAMFYECGSLEEVVIGNDVTVGNKAFYVDRDNHFTVERSKNQKGAYQYNYKFHSPLVSLTIGNNVTIGENAFANAASLESVTLGENAVIGDMAFYNCSSLKQIDLSKVLSIGEYAFSGDVFNICSDTDMTVAAVSTEGTYIYSYHGPLLETVDLSSATEIGAYAFAYCRLLTDVTLGQAVTEIGDYTFAGCVALRNIDLTNIASVGNYAFMETAISEANLVNATSVGNYAFVICSNLQNVVLNESGTVIGEGAFAQNELLTAVTNLNMATEIGAYAFAYTGMVDVDLSGAISIGDFAFMKTEPTAFSVVLGDQLVSLGDNPFAMCMVAPFCTEVVETFNGVDYVSYLYTYDISDSVFVIDGSLYCMVPNGLELITYTGMNADNLVIADGTIRITGQALAGSDVRMVTLPASLKAVGHKAFYRCENLEMVIFTSYDAPILEEEFDSSYYESLEHIPGTGNHGEYVDYDGNTVQIEGNGQIPYFMWNATGGLYHNAFYGANFVDYVGYVEDKLMIVRPSNGRYYDTYIFGQYFELDLTVDGAAAADDNTQAFIDAMNRLPSPVGLADEEAVIAARALYNKISGLEQQSLAADAYALLLSAEQRIAKLKETGADPEPDVEPEQPQQTPDSQTASNATIVIVIVALIVVGVAVVILLNLREKKKEQAAKDSEADSEENSQQTEDNQ